MGVTTPTLVLRKLRLTEQEGSVPDRDFPGFPHYTGGGLGMEANSSVLKTNVPALK